MGSAPNVNLAPRAGADSPAAGPLRALVVNAYTMGNWGDTAITEGLIDALRLAGFGHVSLAPVDWRTREAGRIMADADQIVPPLANLYDVPHALRMSKPSTLAWVMSRIVRARLGWPPDQATASYHTADLVVSVGGGFLGGAKAGANLVKVANIQAGVMAGKPTIVAPVSVNPCSPNVARTLRWGLRGTVVFGRDTASVGRLRDLGLDARFAPDLALRAPSLRTASERCLLDGSLPSGVIGWSPRTYRAEHTAWGRPDAAEDRTLEAVRSILAASNYRLRFIPHVRAGTLDDDTYAVDRLIARLTSDERSKTEVALAPATLAESVLAFAPLDLLITSRMHAAISALAVGTPAIAIAYEPKVVGILDDLGLGDRVIAPTADLTAEHITALVARFATPEERARTREVFTAVQDKFADFIGELSGSVR